MATYFSLVDFTEQGVRNVKGVYDRIDGSLWSKSRTVVPARKNLAATAMSSRSSHPCAGP